MPDERLSAASGSVELARLRYEQTFRALDRHSTILNELRNRASIVLSATGIVASLVAPQALTDPYPAAWAVLALVASAGGLLSCIAVLWPVADKGRLEAGDDRWVPWRRRPRAWKVTLGSEELKRLPWDEGERAVFDAIVGALEPARRVNHRTIENRTRMFNAACLLLPFQIAFWVLVILI